MTIEGLGPVDPVSKYGKTNKSSKASKTEKTDSINLSSEAKSMSEVYKAAESVKNTPDVRLDRIAEVKKKLEDPSYIDDKIVESVANSVMDVFGLS